MPSLYVYNVGVSKQMKQKVYHPAADLIRILAGIGVVLIHVTDPFIAYPPYYGIGGSSWWILNLVNALFRVSVPLFVMLSGFLLLDLTQEMNFKQFYKRRLARIGIPVIFWMAFYFVWLALLGEGLGLGDIIHKILTVNLKHLYFLVIIIELYFITPLLYVFMKNTDDKTHKVLLASALIFTLALGTISALYPRDKVNTSQNIVTIFLPYVYYFLVGYFLRKKHISWKHAISLSIVYVYVTLFIAIASGGVISSYFRQYNSVPLVVMTLISFIVLMQFNKISILSEKPIVRKTIQYVASLVFGVYLVHMMIIEFMDRYTSIIPGKVQSPMWGYVFLKTIVVIGLAFGIVAVGKKIPYIKYLFA